MFYYGKISSSIELENIMMNPVLNRDQHMAHLTSSVPSSSDFLLKNKLALIKWVIMTSAAPFTCVYMRPAEFAPGCMLVVFHHVVPS